MYADDHNPPHFHVIASDGRQCLVQLETLRVIEGRVDTATLREVLAWAEANAAALAMKWQELNP